MSNKPTSVVDPVCGMTVTVATAEAHGLTVEIEGRTYAFCRAGCKRAFEAEPDAYLRTMNALPASSVPGMERTPSMGVLPVIDEGMRRWYESCSCCLSEAFPEIKAQLDAERVALAQTAVDPGICEVAEAQH